MFKDMREPIRRRSPFRVAGLAVGKLLDAGENMISSLLAFSPFPSGYLFPCCTSFFPGGVFGVHAGGRRLLVISLSLVPLLPSPRVCTSIYSFCTLSSVWCQ